MLETQGARKSVAAVFGLLFWLFVLPLAFVLDGAPYWAGVVAAAGVLLAAVLFVAVVWVVTDWIEKGR